MQYQNNTFEKWYLKNHEKYDKQKLCEKAWNESTKELAKKLDDASTKLILESKKSKDLYLRKQIKFFLEEIQPKYNEIVKAEYYLTKGKP